MSGRGHGEDGEDGDGGVDDDSKDRHGDDIDCEDGDKLIIWRKIGVKVIWSWW